MKNKLLRLFYEKGYFKSGIKIYTFLLILNILLFIHYFIHNDYSKSLLYGLGFLFCILCIFILKRTDDKERYKSNYEKEENYKIIDM